MIPMNLKELPPHSCIQLTFKGFSEQSIFRFPLDYECYFRLLGKYKLRFGIKIYGFCLMPDYVHLILQSNDSADLITFLEEVNRHYVLYFKCMHQSKGRFWHTSLRSYVIQSYTELVNCLNDIELEPVRAQISKSPFEYLWSSYLYRILFIKHDPTSQSCAGQILDSIALVRGVFYSSGHNISPTLRSFSRDISSKAERRPSLKIGTSLGMGE